VSIASKLLDLVNEMTYTRQSFIERSARTLLRNTRHPLTSGVHRGLGEEIDLVLAIEERDCFEINRAA